MLKYFFFLVLRILIKKHEWKHFCSPTKSTVALSSGVAVVKTASANTTKKNTYRKSNNLNNFPLIQPIILLLFLLRCDWNALCRRELSSDHFLQRQQVNCLADGGFSLLKTRCFLYATDVTIFEKGRSSANWSLSKSTMNDWSGLRALVFPLIHASLIVETLADNRILLLSLGTKRDDIPRRKTIDKIRKREHELIS